jgi:hypothetical protein
MSLLSDEAAFGLRGDGEHSHLRERGQAEAA